MISSRTIAVSLMFPAFLLVAGCRTVIGLEGEPRAFRYELEQAENPDVRNALGVALSGGGIRSAMFSIGVLKSLHEQGILKDVDIISTVSGGSYAAHWLYANELASPSGEAFGDASFRGAALGRNLCELVTRANFVTNWDYISTPLLLRSYPSMYAQRIGRTFGYADGAVLSIDKFDRSPGAKTPYLVVNATVHEPKPQAGFADGLFEITPRLFGNEALGYHAWQHDAPRYRDVVGASGAAQDILEREFRFSRAGGARLDVTLTDGGNSENLGAIALIRRGVKTIIIADGEHNPDYEFTAYTDLKNRLAKWGLTLESTTIDGFLKTRVAGRGHKPDGGLHWATVVRDSDKRLISRIAYLKMVVSDLPYAGDVVARGKAINDEFFDKLRATSTPSGRLWPRRYWHCDQAPDVSHRFQPWFSYHLDGYNAFSKRSHSYALLHRIGGLFDSNFPQYTTLDQSFYGDQSLALIALGYFQASELKRETLR